MNIFQKIGAYEYCAQRGIDIQEFNSKLAGLEAMLPEASEVARAVVPALDDVSIAAIRAMRNRGAKKTDVKEEGILNDMGRVMDKVSSVKEGKEDMMYHTLRSGLLSSILAGNLGGALYFILKRHAQEENAANESLKKRISLYKDLNRQLSSQFSSVPDNSAAASGPVATPGPAFANG